MLTVRVLAPFSPKDVLDGGESDSIAARKVTDALRERLLAVLEPEVGGERARAAGSSSRRSARSARSAR